MVSVWKQYGWFLLVVHLVFHQFVAHVFHWKFSKNLVGDQSAQAGMVHKSSERSPMPWTNINAQQNMIHTHTDSLSLSIKLCSIIVSCHNFFGETQILLKGMMTKTATPKCMACPLQRPHNMLCSAFPAVISASLGKRDWWRMAELRKTPELKIKTWSTQKF